MKCRNCGNEMRLDDVDYNFKGNQNNYFLCDVCQTAAFEKIRYGKSVFVEFFEED